MPRRSINVPGIGHRNAPIPLGARVGQIFYSSAISGTDQATGEFPESADEQVANAFDNLRKVLAAADLAPKDVVSMDVLIEDDSTRSEVNRHWLIWFPDADDRPARHTTVGPLSGRNRAQLKVVAVAEDAAGSPDEFKDSRGKR